MHILYNEDTFLLFRIISMLLILNQLEGFRLNFTYILTYSIVFNKKRYYNHQRKWGLNRKRGFSNGEKSFVCT